VMEMGGAMSHGAVVAREYGIPAVVGVPDATRRISTGERITVDGSAGSPPGRRAVRERAATVNAFICGCPFEKVEYDCAEKHLRARLKTADLSTSY
jgi:predicted kinase